MNRWPRSHTDELDPTIPMSLKEYLESDFHPDRDYIDGAARERHRGWQSHAQMMTIFGALLRDATRHNRLVALTSVRVRVNEQTVLVPDLCLAHRTKPREDVIVTPPKLCVEILDPEDSLDQLSERFHKFRWMGVESLWAIDVANRKGYVAKESGSVDQPEDGVLRISETSFAINLADVFAELDEV